MYVTVAVAGCRNAHLAGLVVVVAEPCVGAIVEILLVCTPVNKYGAMRRRSSSAHRREFVHTHGCVVKKRSVSLDDGVSQ